MTKRFEMKYVIEVPDDYDDVETELILDRLLGDSKDNGEIIDYEITECEELITYG